MVWFSDWLSLLSRLGLGIICASRLGLCSSLEDNWIPLSIPPSQYWDGNDGPWSSFGLAVGSPAQNVRLLPGTSATACNSQWIIFPEGCSINTTDDCASRGFAFNSNKSSTWSLGGLSNDGLYGLYIYEESFLGYNGNAYYGYDDITLGWQSGLPTLSHQLVAGIAATDFYIGSLGLSPLPMNFTDFNEPQPSMLKTLKNASLISSTSWAYTAGAFYQEPKVFGSLTLGGYDTNRFTPNNMTIPFGADESRDLLVGIQAITSDTTDIPLLSTGVYAFIDSLVPQIWLPLNACTAFEQAFNLTWDNSSQLYLLTNDQHESLLGLNANLTFKIGLSATEGPSVDIVLPYGAFDLTVSPPLVENTTRCLPLSLIMSPLNTDDSPRYFPIRRSQNDTQYTLGRTFLQQAYVIADYDRSSFSVSQALFPSTSVSQNLRAILSPSISASQEHHVSTKTIIASVTSGSAIFFAIVIFVLLFLRRRRHRRSTREQGQRKSSTEKDRDQYYQKPELDAIGPTRVELDATGTLNELDALSLSNNHIDPPLRVDAFRAEAVPTSYELAAEDVPRPELESPHIPGKQQAGT